MIAPGIMGKTVGGMLGSGAGHLIDRITGVGDYTVKTNTLIKASPVPSFGKGCIRLQHREMLGNIKSSSNFVNYFTDINPGLPNMFPWLSQIAQNFEMYKFHGLIFEFVSTSGDALSSTNTALGKIIMATDYNVLDPQFANEQQMYATEFSNGGKPAANLLHAVECAPPESPLKLYYVRNGAAPEGSDLRFYDLGKFQLAVVGCQDVGHNIGELWVSYDVSLCKPSIQALQEGDALLAGHARLTNYSPLSPSGPWKAVQNILMFPGSNIIIDNPTLDRVELSTNVTTQKFFCYFQWTTSGAVAAPNLLSGFSIQNGASEAFFQNGIVGFNDIPGAGVSVTKYGCCFILRADAPGLSKVGITFPVGAAYGTVQAVDIMISQIPNSLLPFQ